MFLSSPYYVFRFIITVFSCPHRTQLGVTQNDLPPNRMVYILQKMTSFDQPIGTSNMNSVQNPSLVLILVGR